MIVLIGCHGMSQQNPVLSHIVCPPKISLLRVIQSPHPQLFPPGFGGSEWSAEVSNPQKQPSHGRKSTSLASFGLRYLGPREVDFSYLTLGKQGPLASLLLLPDPLGRSDHATVAAYKLVVRGLPVIEQLISRPLFFVCVCTAARASRYIYPNGLTAGKLSMCV